ncbi:uncharacterized protein LOC132741465 [Ruditapes philippinarum]|uniref:uncharacterized protein LOC132741465 n=1 Tax=Ruditapes philippinarum TaxID=129788 RepID=UPI00295B0914|nr:uncharacterized protein LOC132741465 [Ruditapes philippinarum]
MDEGKPKRVRTAAENARTVKEDVNDFEEMRHQLTDIVSNKVFNKGIISPDDRESLRELLREIKDVIHDIETVANNTFDIVSKQNLTKRKAQTRKKYRNLMDAFDNDKNIASTLKDEGPDSESCLTSTDPLDLDNSSTHSTSYRNTQANINHGYESDASNANFEAKEETVSVNSKTVLKIENRMDGSYSSSTSTDSRRKPHRVLAFNKPDLYGGSPNYFIDDYEAASTISVSSGDNWTLRKSTLSVDTENDNNSRRSDINGHLRNNKVKSDEFQKNWNPASREERKPMTSSLDKGIHHTIDQSDENDYDDTVLPPFADGKYDKKDVDDVLGDFDYLNEYQSQSDASNVSLCGSEESLKSAAKKDKYKNQTGKANTLDDKDQSNDPHRDKKSVNDVLGIFDYLNDYHSRTNSTSTASLFDSDDDMDLDIEIKPASQSVNKYKDSVSVNDNTKLELDKSGVRKDTNNDHVNVNSRVSEHLPEEFMGYGLIGSDIELKPDYENTSMLPFHRNDYAMNHQSDYSNINNAEKSVSEEKSHLNIAYGIEDKGVRAFQDRYPAYDSNRTANKYDRKKALLDKAHSEEVVSGYTHGEFILRRTQSEDQNGVFKPKLTSPLEVVPENTYPTSVYNDNVEYAKKNYGNPDTRRFDKCDFLIKFLMVILFGIGVSEIIFGIVYRKDCNWDETVPVCAITSGGVSICYCAIFLGINMVRKRKVKLSPYFRVLMVIMWLILLGMIVAGGVLLYPSIKDYAFNDCTGEQDCCRRKLILITFCAIIIDTVCQICFAISICCVH